MLFCGGLVAVFGSEAYGVEGAGPLGVISAAFVSIYFWSKQGWNIEDVRKIIIKFDGSQKHSLSNERRLHITLK